MLAFFKIKFPACFATIAIGYHSRQKRDRNKEKSVFLSSKTETVDRNVAADKGQRKFSLLERRRKCNKKPIE